MSPTRPKTTETRYVDVVTCQPASHRIARLVMEIVTDHARRCKPANTQSERLAPPTALRDPLVNIYLIASSKTSWADLAPLRRRAVGMRGFTSPVDAVESTDARCTKARGGAWSYRRHGRKHGRKQVNFLK